MRCVLYLRCSTTEQARGSSLQRQLETCLKYASEMGLRVSGVFADCQSGDGPMPNRDIAFVSAATLKCPIVVESVCRWSRQGACRDHLSDDTVIYATLDAWQPYDAYARRHRWPPRPRSNGQPPDDERLLARFEQIQGQDSDRAAFMQFIRSTDSMDPLVG